MNFSFGKSKKDKYSTNRNNTSFSNGKYSLTEVITLLKNKAVNQWGAEESIEITTAIASLRESILEQNYLDYKTASLPPLEASRENANVVFKLGQTVTNFNLLCEKNGLKSPLVGLKGHEVTSELYKLAKLDKAFYGNKDAFVATEELIIKKQAENPSDREEGFFNQKVKHKFVNIKIYDTVILLRILASQQSGELSAYLSECLNELEDIVSRRKMLETKQEQHLELIAKKQELDKNLKALKIVNASIEDVSRKLGALETNLATIANSEGIPNAFDSTLATKEVWESLSNMFAVLNQQTVTARQEFSNTTLDVKEENTNENITSDKEVGNTDK